jgi:hypothetical protein
MKRTTKFETHRPPRDDERGPCPHCGQTMGRPDHPAMLAGFAQPEHQPGGLGNPTSKKEHERDQRTQ